jgi:hypothetical protein
MANTIVYNFKSLEELVSKETDVNEEIFNFFTEFNYNKVLNLEKQKNDSQFVFINEINESSTKSTIIQLLNKLNKLNLQKIYSSLKEIVFESNDEINELIKQCIIKIKQESTVLRSSVGELCKNLSSTFFLDKDKNKIQFIKLLLNATFDEYKIAMNYSSPDWDESAAKKSMILLGTLMNADVIGIDITERIIEDFIKRITYTENQEQKYYEGVEKAMTLLSLLMSMISEENYKYKFINVKEIINDELVKYEQNKCIARKTRILFKDALSKLEDKS